MWSKILGVAIGGFVVCPAISMLCWNYLAPTFGLPQLGYWQMVVLHVLVGSLTPLQGKAEIK
jgi:hypothetical protein